MRMVPRTYADRIGTGMSGGIHMWRAVWDQDVSKIYQKVLSKSIICYSLCPTLSDYGLMLQNCRSPGMVLRRNQIDMVVEGIASTTRCCFVSVAVTLNLYCKLALQNRPRYGLLVARLTNSVRLMKTGLPPGSHVS